MEEIGKIFASATVQQGAFGITTLLFLGLYVWQVIIREKDRKQFLVDLEEIQQAHKIEIASERKLNQELQEKRYIELGNSLNAVNKFTATMDNALAALYRGSRDERAS